MNKTTSTSFFLDETSTSALDVIVGNLNKEDRSEAMKTAISLCLVISNELKTTDKIVVKMENGGIVLLMDEDEKCDCGPSDLCEHAVDNLVSSSYCKCEVPCPNSAFMKDDKCVNCEKIIKASIDYCDCTEPDIDKYSDDKEFCIGCEKKIEQVDIQTVKADTHHGVDVDGIDDFPINLDEDGECKDHDYDLDGGKMNTRCLKCNHPNPMCEE